MLKEYHEQGHKEMKSCAVVVTSNHCKQEVEEPEAESDSLSDNGVRLNNSAVLSTLSNELDHLPVKEASKLKCLILEYAQLFPDTPTQTRVMCHDIDVGDANPIKQHAYRVNPQKRKLFQQEVKYMLDTGLIEPIHSAWNSPCLLVPKADGTFRFCTDFRKVNALTKPNSYPLPQIEDCIDQV